MKSLISVTVLFTLIIFHKSINAMESVCEVLPDPQTPSENIVRCPNESLQLEINKASKRRVRYQLPLGEPPEGGWPVILFLKPGFSDVTFVQDSYNTRIQAVMIKEFLDSGYAVIAPDANFTGIWQTNLLFRYFYKLTTDYRFFKKLFSAIEDEKFGPLNSQRKYALGASQGGYNTSRMAINFPDEFNSLVIISGSYATCRPYINYCHVPRRIDNPHPPTFFIHGGRDEVVTVSSMLNYHDKLYKNGIATGYYVNPDAAHNGWIEGTLERTLRWIRLHP